MALQKNIAATVDVPSRFRDYRFSGHVADAASGDNAGKLALTYWPAIPMPPGQESSFGGFVEDIPDNVLTANQRQKLRAYLKRALEHFQTAGGVTGTPDADPDEPALT